MGKLLLLLFLSVMLIGCENRNINSGEVGVEITESSAEETTGEEVQEQTVIVEQEDDTDGAPVAEMNESTYAYEEITVTIPASWQGKVLVKDGDDGFAFFQKASYEKEEGMGFLYGFYKSENMIDQSAGATQLAYTDEYMYYMQQPTDVSCYYEDENIAREYGVMMEERENLVRSLVIDAENVRYDAREYMLPMSNVKVIPDYLLVNFSLDELWIARNEIYARRGRKFDNGYLAGYFESCTWYEPKVEGKDFDESVLSQTEKDNLEMIVAYEDAKSKEKSFPIKMEFGKGYKMDLDGDGTDEDFSLDFYGQDYDYVVNLILGGDMAYDLSAMGGYYCCLNTDEYYITDISPFFEGLEIAVMDYGASEDLVTHFYAVDQDGVHYIGSVGGFPFKEYMNKDGFVNEGGVIGTVRTDLIHTCYSYGYWYYNFDEKSLDLQDTGFYQMVPDGGHELKAEIPLYTITDVKSETVALSPGQKIFFCSTDGKEWIEVKGKDGTVGYLHITDHKIDGVTEEPSEIIEGINFAD